MCFPRLAGYFGLVLRWYRPVPAADLPDTRGPVLRPGIVGATGVSWFTAVNRKLCCSSSDMALVAPPRHFSDSTDSLDRGHAGNAIASGAVPR